MKLLLAAALVGASLVAAPPAGAIPTGCSENGLHTGSYLVHCSGGTGQFQAYANCHNDLWPFDAKMAYGSWQNVGGYSNASCYGPPFTSFKVYTGGRSLR
jgi:hypothetical protein